MPIFRQPKRGLKYSEGITRVYASADEDEVLLDTLEFRHASFVTAGLPYCVRVVNDNAPLLATLEDDAPLNPGEEVEFLATRFGLTRPAETDAAGESELALTVDNAALVLIPYLDAAKGSRDPILVSWRPYLPSDLSAPHMLPVLTFALRDVKADILRVTARAGFPNMGNRRFPAIEYRASTHPGLAAR